jgi:hypothetical protein
VIRIGTENFSTHSSAAHRRGKEKPHVERVTCRKVTAELAERRAVIWARRWVDLKGDKGAHDQ